MFKTISAIVFLLTTLNAWPQAHKAHPLRVAGNAYAVGARAGMNFSNMEADFANYYSGESATGIYFGLLLHKPVATAWALQPELYFSRQDFHYMHSAADPAAPGAWGDDVKLSYLNLPVKLAYLHSSGLCLQTGPQLGLLLSTGYMHKAFDFSWVAGASFISRSGFGIEARYNLGLNNINGGNEYYFYATKEKHRVLQLGVMYMFSIVKKR